MRGTRRAGRVRRAARWSAALVALTAFAVPLAYGVNATLTYTAGYWSRISGGRTAIATGTDSALFWHDPRGDAVHGRIADVPPEWQEEYIDGTGTPVWVSPRGIAYLQPPTQDAMAVGYTGAGVVAAGAALVLRGRRGARSARAEGTD